jgi:protein-S-isoprenylcysteine O-methyltransferase Ste14
MSSRTAHAKPPWWKGARGEWYVVTQTALLALILLGPRHWPGPFTLPNGLARAASVAGIALMVAGGGLVLAGFYHLRRNLTPLPYPKADGHLVERGVYRLVRHPIYAGVIAMAFAWALLVHGLLTLGYAVVLLVFFDVKSRREERWLREKYPGYRRYAERVRKLIPYLY